MTDSYLIKASGHWVKFWYSKGRKRAQRTTQFVLDRLIRDPVLKKVLTAVWGDYGLNPEESAVAIHAQIVTHYRAGAWFPEGGGRPHSPNCCRGH